MLSVLIGVTCTALVYIVPYLGNILPLVMSLGGISDGATLGIFTCALLLPGVNARVRYTILKILSIFYYLSIGCFSWRNSRTNFYGMGSTRISVLYCDESYNISFSAC